jgi:hypothetical protein
LDRARRNRHLRRLRGEHSLQIAASAATSGRYLPDLVK